MEIFRIESIDGRGICLSVGSPLCLAYRLGAALAFEPPERERCTFPCKAEDCKAFDATAFGGDESERQHMHYGFPTLTALRDWFPGLRGRLAMQGAGARGHVFEVPELVATGPWQIVFDKRKATKIGEFDLGSLERLT
jgi:hypothetical protein